jgi:hypothetical protein
MDDDDARFVILFPCRKVDYLCIPRDVSFFCISGVASGSGLVVQPPVVALVRADVVSSFVPCLTVADVHSTITMRAGETQALDVAACPRSRTVGGEGRWIATGLSVLLRRLEVSMMKRIDLCICQFSRVFCVKFQGCTVL